MGTWGIVKLAKYELRYCSSLSRIMTNTFPTWKHLLQTTCLLQSLKVSLKRITELKQLSSTLSSDFEVFLCPFAWKAWLFKSVNQDSILHKTHVLLTKLDFLYRPNDGLLKIHTDDYRKAFTLIRGWVRELNKWWHLLHTLILIHEHLSRSSGGFCSASENLALAVQ